MRAAFFAGLVVCGVLASVPSVSKGQNLISNGSFENPEIFPGGSTGLTVFNQSARFFQESTTVGQALIYHDDFVGVPFGLPVFYIPPLEDYMPDGSHGSQFLVLGSEGGQQVIRCDVQLNAGWTYRFEWWWASLARRQVQAGLAATFVDANGNYVGPAGGGAGFDKEMFIEIKRSNGDSAYDRVRFFEAWDPSSGQFRVSSFVFSAPSTGTYSIRIWGGGWTGRRVRATLSTGVATLDENYAVALDDLSLTVVQTTLGACCTASGACTLTDVNGCSAIGQRWLGPDVPCTPGICDTATACCNSLTGQCAVVSVSGCLGVGLSASVLNTPCSPEICPVPPAPTGACCQAVNCAITTQAACVGAYLGDNRACGPGGPNPCCAADFNNSQSLGVEDIFAFLNVWFAGCP